MKKQRKKRLSAVKTVREISRRRIGAPRSVHVFQGKKDRLLDKARKLDANSTD